MKSFILLLLLSICVGTSLAQVPDWSTSVAAIIYNRCSNCHHSGGIAPFALMTYTDAVNNATSIGFDVNINKMPPWPPDPNYSHMAHERILSSTEKTKILAWVNGGTPAGNLSLAPPQPVFSTAGDLPGTADLTVRIPTYTSPAATSDMYRCFVLPTNQTADQYITAFEAIPGNRSIVHHVLVYADTTGQSTALDAADPGPGYTSFGGIGTNNAILLGGWVPGSSPLKYPTGFGTKLPKNAKLVIQIHYPTGTAGMQDSTQVRFFFSKSPVRDVFIIPVLNHSTNITPALVIPANTVKSFVEQQYFPLDISILGIAPHMHLLGQNIRSFGVAPSGDTQNYINIPKWDFHWQGFYLFDKIKKFSAGTTAFALATYDNTTNNPDNPSSPPKLVTLGESTTDEMMLVYFVFSYYQPGDENIVIDPGNPAGVNTTSPLYKSVELFQAYPVPAQQEMIAKFYLNKAATGSLVLLNMEGQLVKSVLNNSQLSQGYSTQPIDVSSLPSGTYMLELQTGNSRLRQECVVLH